MFTNRTVSKTFVCFIFGVLKPLIPFDQLDLFILSSSGLFLVEVFLFSFFLLLWSLYWFNESWWSCWWSDESLWKWQLTHVLDFMLYFDCLSIKNQVKMLFLCLFWAKWLFNCWKVKQWIQTNFIPLRAELLLRHEVTDNKLFIIFIDFSCCCWNKENDLQSNKYPFVFTHCFVINHQFINMFPESTDYYY